MENIIIIILLIVIIYLIYFTIKFNRYKIRLFQDNWNRDVSIAANDLYKELINEINCTKIYVNEDLTTVPPVFDKAEIISWLKDISETSEKLRKYYVSTLMNKEKDVKSR